MSALAVLAAAAAQVVAPGPAAFPAACASVPFSIGGDVDVIKAYRVFVGPDGASHVETVALPGKRGVFFGGSVKLTQFDLGRPTHVAMTFGQPGMAIPPHPAPYREIFIILAGSSRMVMPDGQALDLVPGTLFMADDVGATKGRSGLAGKCGYLALDLQFSSPPLPETSPSYDKK